jgi:mRNA-degrading endonuclease YafQ of YafQ-DinJ toxin-antitoxin module
LTYSLVVTAGFEKRLTRFRRLHPELRVRLAALFLDLETDPFAHQLRLHALQGELAGLHAVRLTQSYRVILTLRLAEQEIVLLDIGTRDEVYR